MYAIAVNKSQELLLNDKIDYRPISLIMLTAVILRQNAYSLFSIIFLIAAYCVLCVFFIISFLLLSSSCTISIKK